MKIFLICILLCCSSCTLWLEEMRRPQVMTGVAPVIDDLNPILNPSCMDEEDEEETGTLSPEFFNPYHPLEEKFVLSIGDLLEISVFGDEETEYRNVVVAPDGRLYYTFVDGIPAAGRTLQEVRKDLEESLSRYFIHPMVVIIPLAAFSQSYKIFGRVQQPGVYPIDAPIKLREAIGTAGGISRESYQFKDRNSRLNPIADLKRSFIIRNGEKLPIDFEKLLYTPTSNQNIYLRPGDYIFIADADPQEVYVLGGAILPSRVEYVEGMTLTEALAEARGFTIGDPYSADMSRVLVIRGALECPLVVEVDLLKLFHGEMRDIILMPNDIVFVYHKSLRFGRALVRAAANAFVQGFATTAAGYYAQFQWFTINTTPDMDDVSPP